MGAVAAPNRDRSARHRHRHRCVDREREPTEGDLDACGTRLVADQSVRQVVRGPVGGAGSSDAEVSETAATVVLQEGLDANGFDCQPGHLVTSRNSTTAPGRRTEGGSAAGFQSTASVWPSSCHPPGETRG